MTLLLAIHRGALETPPWSTFLRQVRTTQTLSYASLIFRERRRTRSVYREYHDADSQFPDLRKRYRSEFARTDPFAYHAMDPDRIYCLEDVLPEGDPFQNAWYRECLFPMGFTDLAINRLIAPDGSSAWLTLASAQGAISQGVMDIMREIRPHLQVALEAFMMREALSVKRSLLNQIAQGVGVYCILISPELKVIDASQDVQDCFPLIDGIWLDDGNSLCFSSPEHRRIFRKAARDVAEDGGEWFYQISEDDEVFTEIAFVSPQYRTKDQIRQPSSIKMYIHRRPAYRPESAHLQQRLRQLFGLTKLEARIVDKLCAGDHLSEIAEGLSITGNTVKGYLKTIFSKIGASRQADVVRIVKNSVISMI